MDTSKSDIQTEELVELKKLLMRRSTPFNKEQITELTILLDKEIERNNIDKEDSERKNADVPQETIDTYKKVLNLLNNSAFFAAIGASGGAVLAITALGTALLPVIGTLIGGLIPIIGIGAKAFVEFNSNKNK